MNDKGGNLKETGSIDRFQGFVRTHRKTTIALGIFTVVIILYAVLWVNLFQYRKGHVVEGIPSSLGRN